MMHNTIWLFQNAVSDNPFSMLGLGTVIGAVILILYIGSSIFQNNYKGRKEYIEVQALNLADITQKLEQSKFENEELKKRIESLEERYNDLLEDKVLLMREHHQLLELSSSDLKRLKKLTHILSDVEGELNKYREEKGLAPIKSSLLLDDE